jgi:hypothetical protein
VNPVGSDYIEQRDELLESIERDQEELRAAVHELTGAARETFALSEQIRERPWTWISAAFLFGLWLGIRGNRPTNEC